MRSLPDRYPLRRTRRRDPEQPASQTFETNARVFGKDAVDHPRSRASIIGAIDTGQRFLGSARTLPRRALRRRARRIQAHHHASALPLHRTRGVGEERARRGALGFGRRDRRNSLEYDREERAPGEIAMRRTATDKTPCYIHEPWTYSAGMNSNRGFLT